MHLVRSLLAPIRLVASVRRDSSVAISQASSSSLTSGAWHLNLTPLDRARKNILYYLSWRELLKILSLSTIIEAPAPFWAQDEEGRIQPPALRQFPFHLSAKEY